MNISTLRHGDNFIYVLHEGGSAAVVDPGVAPPVHDALQALGCSLELILITHHHSDHAGGVAPLKKATGCRAVGPSGGLAALDQLVGEGAVVPFAGHTMRVLSVPGHTQHDVAYYLPDEKALFPGDVLFAGGCGRMFSGPAELMWESLCRLRALPDDTRVFGGHDYVLDNLEFAAFVETDNADIRERIGRFRRNSGAGAPFEVPTLAEEKRTNPFLRCRDAAEFARLRSRKDQW
jgi:hydroxyacylglutathione hydrolase